MSAGEGLGILEERLGHRFGQPALLETALRHPSFSHETDGTRGNERLEFLGDAALGLVVAEMLYEAHPGWPEGDLTRARAALVNARSLAARARELGLGDHIRLGRTEQRTGGGKKERILANVLEAVVGAMQLDGGAPVVRAFAERLFSEAIRTAPAPAPDAKTRLQEWTHAQLQRTPTYRTIRDSGVDEDPDRFHVEVRVEEEAWGAGRGRTKRLAQQAAAEAALGRTREEGA